MKYIILILLIAIAGNTYNQSISQQKVEIRQKNGKSKVKVTTVNNGKKEVKKLKGAEAEKFIREYKKQKQQKLRTSTSRANSIEKKDNTTTSLKNIKDQEVEDIKLVEQTFREASESFFGEIGDNLLKQICEDNFVSFYHLFRAIALENYRGEDLYEMINAHKSYIRDIDVNGNYAIIYYAIDKNEPDYDRSNTLHLEKINNNWFIVGINNSLKDALTSTLDIKSNFDKLCITIGLIDFSDLSLGKSQSSKEKNRFEGEEGKIKNLIFNAVNIGFSYYIKEGDKQMINIENRYDQSMFPFLKSFRNKSLKKYSKDEIKTLLDERKAFIRNIEVNENKGIVYFSKHKYTPDYDKTNTFHFEKINDKWIIVGINGYLKDELNTVNIDQEFDKLCIPFGLF